MTTVPRRSLCLVVRLLAVVLTSALADCANGDSDAATVDTNAARQAYAAQSSIASAQAAQEHHYSDMMNSDMMMHDEDGGWQPEVPSDAGVASRAEPAMPPPASAAPGGMASMLGRAPQGSDVNSRGGLPRAVGAPHIYHLAAESFFLDQASTTNLTSEQQRKLTAFKKNAEAAYATTQRKIDQGEQEIYVLTSSEAPNITKIESKAAETARLTVQQRVDFIRAVGAAVGVLSDAQRKAVASQGSATPTVGVGSAPDAPAMGNGGSLSPEAGMAVSAAAPPMAAGGMPPTPGGMVGTSEAGAAPSMGHM